jgi:toxin CptA
MRSSNASVPCRFELRPSRWLIGAMLATALLAPFAVLNSQMPRWAAWPLAVLSIAIALRQARREGQAPVRAVVIDGEGAASVDGQGVEAFRVDWRGPFAFVSWRDAEGRKMRRSLWPDTLSSSLRRELRLAAAKGGDGQARSSMAP